LEVEDPQLELEENDEYQTLVSELDSVREAVDEIVHEFDSDDIAAVLPGSATCLSDV
jgi:hypothetical protein